MVIHVFNSSIVSGPETLVLPALKKLGETVHIVFLVEERRGEAGREPLRFAQGLGLITSEVRVRSRWDKQAIKNLAGLLDTLASVSGEITVVHAHDVKASTYVLRASRRSNVARMALVSTHHGIHGRPDWKTRLYEKFYSYFVLPYFDRIVAVSEADRQELIRRGLDPGKVFLHLNGVDRPKVEPEHRPFEKARLREVWGLNDQEKNSVLIGIVGRLSAEKRHDRLLRVAAEMHRMEPFAEWKILIFGAGPLEPLLREQADQLGLGQRLRWMGYRKEIGQEMAGFDIVILLSDAEGMPITLLEAGWAGTAVLATDVGGIPYILDQGRCGVTVSRDCADADIAKKLMELMNSDEKRTQFGCELQKRVESNFSGGIWLQNLQKLYGEVRIL